MLHSITGIQSSGKTLKMTLDGFMDFAKGRTIISNYHLNFPHFRINKDFLLWSMENEKSIEKATYLLDELWLWLDSRSSMTNRVLTYFFLQSSKLSNNIYFTAQSNTQNDVRLRENLNTISKCERVLFVGDKFISCNQYLSEHPEIDERMLNDELNKILYIKIKTFERFDNGFISDIRLKKTEYIYAKAIFGLYNTRQKMVNQR